MVNPGNAVHLLALGQFRAPDSATGRVTGYSAYRALVERFLLLLR
jgi:hypothetical protein